MNWAFFIKRLLWAIGVLTVVLLLSGGLWGGLNSLGDFPGAQGAKGVFLVAGLAWLASFIALVICSAIALLQFSGDILTGSEKSDSENERQTS
ncbi:MAG: hypothetical protein Tsb009_08820 [Planctomycetaceae bacterium]